MQGQPKWYARKSERNMEVMIPATAPTETRRGREPV